MNNFIQDAMSLRQLGYSVIPIQPKSKKPFVRWKRFQEKPAEDTEIEEWAANFPECGVGIVTGKVSGNLVILDVDPRNGGDKSIEGKHLPPTPCVQTGGGGFHYYFRYDHALPSGPIAPGLDFKAEKSYVVAPPSVHSSGRIYTWAPGLSPAEIERAPLPEWILELVAKKDLAKEQEIERATPPMNVDDSDVLAVTELIKPHWTKGQRNHLSLSLSGCLAKCKWPWERTEKVISFLSQGDEEAKSRLETLKATYKKLESGEKVKGYQGLVHLLPQSALQRLIQIVMKRDPAEPVWMKINHLRQRDVPAVEKRRLVAECVQNDLARSHGEFLVAAGPEHYFFERKSRAIFPIDSRDMRALLDSAYRLNSSELETKCVIDHLVSHAHRFGKWTEIYHTCHYDKGNHILYINLADGRVARLDGNDVQIVDNGTDGVLFMDEMDAIEPVLGATDNPRQLMFEGVSFDRSIDRAHQEVLCWAWFRSLFFFPLLPARPIFALIGPKGSGKTFLLKKWLRLFYGAKRTEPDCVTKEDAFEASLSNNYLLTLDNVDEKLGWLNDSLARAATGQIIRKRQLYTTNDEVSFQPRCFVSLNSRSPHFKREDVSDRLLIIRLERLPQGDFTRENILLDPFMGAGRNKVWGSVLAELNGAVRWLKEHRLPPKTEHRLADWEALASILAEKDKEGPVLKAALKGMETERVNFVLEDDPIVPFLKDLSDGEWRTATQIWEKIGGKDSPFRASRSLAAHLGKVTDSLRSAFGMKIDHDRHTKVKVYAFPTGAGQLPDVLEPLEQEDPPQDVVEAYDTLKAYRDGTYGGMR